MLIDTRTGTTSDFLLPCCIIGRLSLKQLVSIMKVIRKLNELFARCVMLSIDKKRKIEGHKISVHTMLVLVNTCLHFSLMGWVMDI